MSGLVFRDLDGEKVVYSGSQFDGLENDGSKHLCVRTGIGDSGIKKYGLTSAPLNDRYSKMKMRISANGESQTVFIAKKYSVSGLTSSISSRTATRTSQYTSSYTSRTNSHTFSTTMSAITSSTKATNRTTLTANSGTPIYAPIGNQRSGTGAGVTRTYPYTRSGSGTYTTSKYTYSSATRSSTHSSTNTFKGISKLALFSTCSSMTETVRLTGKTSTANSGTGYKLSWLKTWSEVCSKTSFVVVNNMPVKTASIVFTSSKSFTAMTQTGTASKSTTSLQVSSSKSSTRTATRTSQYTSSKTITISSSFFTNNVNL